MVFIIRPKKNSNIFNAKNRRNGFMSVAAVFGLNYLHI